MSNPQPTRGDSERPPGPHRPEIQIITQTSPPSSKGSENKSRSDNPRDSKESSKNDSHQPFVLTDPIAFRYLEEDPSVSVLERHKELVGYEIYVVEQWATSRAHPTFVITTYTGDPAHKAWVSVLNVPTDESTWSQRLRVYFKALNQYHARRRETPLGIIMITNLSGFPSSLTVIPVPDGELRKRRMDFFVNENLKRMGCSGRVGLSLTPPSGATAAKFHQLYRTSDKNPLYSSVVELVKLCQAALHLFDKLEIDYADGLLCDVTEKAINDWWFSIGSEFYNIEPRDGILGPTTVVALLGLLMGARNRLHAVSASAPKDPFDIGLMKRAIGSFQKSQRIAKTRRLDRDTLNRLHRASAKAASSEGWSVPRAVKSTVAELSGKGGEMLAEVVGRRDKAGIADIETSDIDRFHQLVYGERCRWLWQGKPLKSLSMDTELADPERRLVLKPDDNGGFTWTGRKEKLDAIAPGKGFTEDTEHDLERVPSSKEAVEDLNREDPVPHKSVIRRATGLIHDKRNAGLGKIKDAVGRRGHNRSESSKDDPPASPIAEGDGETKRPFLWRSHTSPPVSPKSPKGGENSLDRQMSFKAQKKTDELDHTLVQPPEESVKGFIPLGRQSLDDKAAKESAFSRQRLERQTTTSTYETQADGEQDEEYQDLSTTSSMYHGVNLHNILPEPSTFAQEIGPLLRRTNSETTFVAQRLSKPRSDDYYPRHMSFSLAEESLIEDTDLLSAAEPRMNAPLDEQYLYESNLSSDLKGLRALIAELDRGEATWTRSQLFALRSLLDQADKDTQTIEHLYHEPLTVLQDLNDSSAVLLRDERDALGEAGKELEALAARMDYEISGMRGKVEDVEVGVQDFERAVDAVEDRVRDLEEGEGKAGKMCILM